MRTYAMMKNPAAYVADGGGKAWPLVAGGAGDNTAVYSAEFDKRDLDYNVESAVMTLASRAVLAEDKTLTTTIVVQHTADEDFNTPANIEEVEVDGTLLTGGAGGSTEVEDRVVQIDVAELLPRWRVKLTPDLNAANTDTAQVAFYLLLAGKSHI